MALHVKWLIMLSIVLMVAQHDTLYVPKQAPQAPIPYTVYGFWWQSETSGRRTIYRTRTDAVYVVRFRELSDGTFEAVVGIVATPTKPPPILPVAPTRVGG
jgi:hypothetical protein